jgi:hypothetical protein
MASNWSVTLAMALTTTTGFWGRRALTMAAARSIASASCTDVPPNFMTIIQDSCATDFRQSTRMHHALL